MSFSKTLQSIFKEIETRNLKPISIFFDENKEIMVSVHCLVYNQVNYLRRCLDSILKQKTDFNVEIIVHDDNSSDGSANIVNEYASKYPNIIKPILQKQNVYSKTGNFLEIETYTTKKSSGRYIAICEADDYWTDQYKLFLQVNLMEKYQQSHFSIHKVISREENSEKVSFLPSMKIKGGLIDSKRIIGISNRSYEFQTSSYFFRKQDYCKFIFNLPKFAKAFPTDDEALIHYFGSIGPTLYIPREMSCYTKYCSNSWSSSHLLADTAEKNKKYNKYVSAIRLYDAYFDYNFHKQCEYVFLNYSLRAFLDKKYYKGIMKEKKLRHFLLRKNFRLYLSILLRRVK